MYVHVAFVRMHLFTIRYVCYISLLYLFTIFVLHLCMFVLSYCLYLCVMCTHCKLKPEFCRTRGAREASDLALASARSDVIRRELDLAALNMGCNLFLLSCGCDSSRYY